MNLDFWMLQAMYWIIGLLFSVFVGHVVIASSLVFLHIYLKEKKGEFEKFSKMVGWITLKALATQPHRKQRAEAERMSSPIQFKFANLLGNLASMFFALVGGLIISAGKS